MATDSRATSGTTLLIGLRVAQARRAGVAARQLL
jgi:hypothetical protein